MLEICNFTKNKINTKFFRKISEVVLEETTPHHAGCGARKNTEISLVITGNARMRKLNKFHRGKNRVTDVLSFANNKEKFIEAPDGVERLGEIVICYPRAKKQAKHSEHSLEKELTTLFIHGILHLLGYDHENDEEEKKMKKMEGSILLKLI